MKHKIKVAKASGKVAHFSWPDLLVLAGAAILVPVSIYEHRWFFLVIGLAIAAAIGIRVMITRALSGRAQSGSREASGRAQSGSREASGQPCALGAGRDPGEPQESKPAAPVAPAARAVPVAPAAPAEPSEPPQGSGHREGRQ